MANLNSPTPVVVNSLVAFADNMVVFSERFRNNIGVMAVKTGIVVVQEAAVRTPVDTSEARSNWTLDTVRTQTLRSPYTTGRHQGIGERAAYSAVVAAARRSGGSISKEHVCAGKPIFVSNPTPYIVLLAGGSSSQGGQDMDLIAVELAKGFVESYLRSGRLLTSVDTL